MRTLLIYTLLLLALSACVVSSTMPDYPEGWVSLDVTSPTDRCPQLGGLYAEWGDAPNGCHPGMEACRSLSYNLLGGNIGWKEVFDESTKPRFPIGTHVELRQPSNDRLEVIQWQIDKNQKRAVGEMTLEMEKGDFTCGLDGLKLKPRWIYTLAGVSNIVGTVTRIFNTSEDGCLVVKSKDSYMGHHLIIPGAHSFGIWVRWSASNQNGAASVE